MRSLDARLRRAERAGDCTSPDAPSNSNLRDPDQAFELASRAVELEPKEWNYWDTLDVTSFAAHVTSPACGRGRPLRAGRGSLWQLSQRNAPTSQPRANQGVSQPRGQIYFFFFPRVRFDLFDRRSSISASISSIVRRSFFDLLNAKSMRLVKLPLRLLAQSVVLHGRLEPVGQSLAIAIIAHDVMATVSTGHHLVACTRNSIRKGGTCWQSTPPSRSM